MMDTKTNPTPHEDILAGIKVLDLSRDLAGPLCSMMLAELGADVVEVEHPVTGDETRSWPPLVEGFSGYFAAINRSKRCLAVDLKDNAGTEVVRDLARRSDVVLESFTPGVADRLGLGYPALSELNPRLVYCSISGFGQDGPWRTRRGYDPIMQAMSGFMSVTGEKGRMPVKSTIPVADVTTGVHAFAAILGGLFYRERTGKGQHVDMAMLDVMVSMLSVIGTRYLLTGIVPERNGTENPQRVPSAAFECGDGRYLQLVPNQRQWGVFCGAIGHPEWKDDARFATPNARVENSQALYPMLYEVMKTRSAVEWERVLDGAGIGCSPINDFADVFALDQVKHRGLAVEYPMPGDGTWTGIATPFRYSETPSRVRSRPPHLGEHSVDVLRELGRSEEEIERLLSAGTVRGLQGKDRA
jgi:formyl-CoA transferase